MPVPLCSSNHFEDAGALVNAVPAVMPAAVEGESADCDTRDGAVLSRRLNN